MADKTALPGVLPTTNQKVPSSQDHEQQQHQPHRKRSALGRSLRFAGAAAIVYLTLTLLGGLSRFNFDWSPTRAAVSTPAVVAPRPVPLEAHIMSKCPDARDCLQKLVLPAMQQVADKVNFTLSFIGEPDEARKHVSCKHGEDECAGNIIELCAASIYPDPKIYLGFVMCLSKNYRDIPQDELVSECALEHGMSEERLGECVTGDGGALGMGLLLDSVQRSADAKVQYSCTLRLDDEVRCIRDGGEWKECKGGSSVAELVRDIEKAYHKRQTTNCLGADW